MPAFASSHSNPMVAILAFKITSTMSVVGVFGNVTVARRYFAGGKPRLVIMYAAINGAHHAKRW